MIRGMGMDFLALCTKRSTTETARGIKHRQKNQMALNFFGFKVASSPRAHVRIVKTDLSSEPILQQRLDHVPEAGNCQNVQLAESSVSKGRPSLAPSWRTKGVRNLFLIAFEVLADLDVGVFL
jgi:hypothetical protein